MEQKLKQLKEILAEVTDLNNVAGLLGWDQQTYMPPGGAENRGNQLGTIEKLAHLKFTSDEMGVLLEDLAPYQEQLDPDSNDARLIQVTHREFNKQVRVPAEWIVDYAHETTLGFQAWQKARGESNFAILEPHLAKIFNLRKQYASFFKPYDHPYDPLLDDFEPGLKTADVQRIFTSIRPVQVELIKAITQKPPVDDSIIQQTFDERKQWEFGEEVITKLGFDWKHGRLDKSAHPFTQTSGIDDVRITTRLDPNHLNPCLFANIHETGHALYEMGVDHALDRTNLATGTSLGFHESQSRMYENLVGRSLPFWKYFYPRLQQYFPDQLGSVSLDKFYKAINRVKPTLIRVEADEATYNLHIMLRLELEIALIEGNLMVKDLPEAWNEGMKDYLGLTPTSDAEGVLQDVHWPSGLIGYFSTYSLGNLISLQLWEIINRDIPDLPDQFRKGEFSALLSWLRENVHRHGSKYEPQELVQRITGSKIDPDPYMHYLKEKFGEIYNL